MKSQQLGEEKGLVREATKSLKVTINMMLPPPCFPVSMVFSG